MNGATMETEKQTQRRTTDGFSASSKPDKADLYAKWAKLQYSVMERSFEAHRRIRKLFYKDIAENELIEQFQSEVSAVLAAPAETLSRRNTAYHVWGLLKPLVTKREKHRIFALLETVNGDEEDLSPLKRVLHDLAVKYDVRHLINSTYFEEEMQDPLDGRTVP